MSNDVSPLPSFRDLALIEPLLKALDDVGYETPSPIQAQIIPHMLQGKDVLGQAQTGTGKTAAFALPILSRIDLRQKDPQVLVLTKIIIPSNVSASRMRVSASSLCTPLTIQKRWRMNSADALVTLMVICSGSCRYC